MNQGPHANPAHQEWLKFDDEIKKYGLLTTAIASVVITATFGPQVLYLLLALGGVAGLSFYPDINPERMLYGAVAGFLMVGPTFGPFGLIGGAALGHYLGKRYDQLAHKADQVVNAVGMVTAPIKAVGNAPSSIMSGLKTGWTATKSGVADFYNHVHEVLEEELDKQAYTPEAAPEPVAIPVPPAPQENSQRAQALDDIREQAIAPQPVVRFSTRRPKRKTCATQTEQLQMTDNAVENPAPAVESPAPSEAPRRKKNQLWGMDFPFTIM